MRQFPRGGLLGKCQHFVYRIAALRIPLYAASVSFFLALSAFPGLLLLLAILSHTPLEVEQLAELLAVFLPEPFLEGAEELILLTYDRASYALVGISALTALWSASRGMYGLMNALNGIYGVTETRSWLHKRFLSALYTLAFLVAALLSLGLYGAGSQVATVLAGSSWPILRFLAQVVNWRFWVLLMIQTGLFGAMFLALPNTTGRFRQTLPGAVAASLGWLLFSRGYGLYLQLFAAKHSVYGSVYGLSLAMLWLYCCICILFYGGGLNVLLLRYQTER